MIDTYQDRDALERKFLGSGFKGILLFCALLFGLWAVTGASIQTAGEFSGGLFGLLLPLYAVGFLYEVRHDCAEIRLDDDGSCELVTKHRIVRLHVHQIQSVLYSPATDESSEHYTIRHREGTLHVSRQMTGFADFLLRLKALNPDVDLTSFPDTWAGFAETAPEAPEAANEPWSLGRLVQVGLFPLIVVTLLVLIASQSLGR